MALAAMAVTTLAIIGCGSITKASAPASTAPRGAGQHQRRVAVAVASPSPSPSNSLSSPVGTIYTVTDQSGNKMSVTLTQVIDPAQGADQFTTPDNGNRFVGAVFRPDPGVPTLRPHYRKTAQAGPEALSTVSLPNRNAYRSNSHLRVRQRRTSDLYLSRAPLPPACRPRRTLSMRYLATKDLP